MSKRGSASAGEGKLHPLSMRTTKAIREKLEAAAERSGRSLAAEVEARIEQSLLDEETAGGWQIDSLMRLLAAAISHAEQQAGGNWTEDLAAHAAVERVVGLFIASKRPRLETLLEAETIETIREGLQLVEQARAGDAKTLGELMQPGWLEKAEARKAVEDSIGAILQPLGERAARGRELGDEIAKLLLA